MEEETESLNPWWGLRSSHGRMAGGSLRSPESAARVARADPVGGEDCLLHAKPRAGTTVVSGLEWPPLHSSWGFLSL